ncbi:MAG: hypothetical protein ACK40H_07105, partial [Sphingomonadaceae bacterium]
MTSLLSRSACAALLAFTPLAATTALASPALAPGSGIVRSMPALVPMATSVTSFDVTGIFSVDGLGDPLNERFTLALGSGAHITGIGWDVTLFADSPSFLSEMVVAFGTTSNPYFVFLTPGVTDSFPGIESYSSGGIVDLIGLGLDFFLDADGLLQLEFFETFDDFFDDWDGIWEAGTIDIEYSTGDDPDPVPTPGAFGLLLA